MTTSDTLPFDSISSNLLFPMTDPAKLTDEELESSWMVIIEYTRYGQTGSGHGELTAERDRREREGSARI